MHKVKTTYAAFCCPTCSCISGRSCEVTLCVACSGSRCLSLKDDDVDEVCRGRSGCGASVWWMGQEKMRSFFRK